MLTHGDSSRLRDEVNADGEGDNRRLMNGVYASEGDGIM
jgi:hypothetical protein